MPKFTVDGIVFHSEDLSEDGLRYVDTLQFLAREIQRLDQQIKVFEDSKAVLARTLQDSLPRRDDDEAG